MLVSGKYWANIKKENEANLSRKFSSVVANWGGAGLPKGRGEKIQQKIATAGSTAPGDKKKERGDREQHRRQKAARKRFVLSVMVSTLRSAELRHGSKRKRI